MKILIVITGLGMGGAEKVVTSLADQLAGKGHEVVIAYLAGDVVVKPLNKNIKLVGLSLGSIWTVFSTYFKLRKLVKELKPDVVHSHLVHANILCRLLRLTTAIPRLISSAHNTNEEGRGRMLAYRMTDKLVDISTNVSNEAVVTFIEQKAVRPNRMLTLHNGIPTANFVFSEDARNKVRKELGVSESQQLILAVGRLNESKDYPNLIAAVSALSDEHKDFKVVIAGDGPLRSDLENKVRLLGLEEKVRFLGVREDIPSLMSAADVFVLSSAWEGFGLVVAEAMACERVVVATDCGGVKEVVGDVGFLVVPKDFKSLAIGVGKALQLSANERKNLGEKARQRVLEYYSLDAATEKWLRLYSVPVDAMATALADERNS